MSIYELIHKNLQLAQVIQEDRISMHDFKNCILKNQIHSKVLIVLITNN